MDLDALVHDPRFLPCGGWLDDHRIPPYTGNPAPAIQQNKEEFVEFVSKLNKRDRCLQIGLGTVGASQFVFAHLFKQAWTIEFSSACNLANVILGDSHARETIDRCSALSPFDLLFIDGDKSYDGLRADYYNYEPMVSEGGVIAFHDVIPYADNQSTIIAYDFVEELKAKGKQFTTIGTLLGIAYCYK
jgi:predicted O-methyltransferase YrrM